MTAQRGARALALKRAGFFTSFNGLSHDSVTSPAFKLLESNLRAHGNDLSDHHRTALYALVGLMTEMAQGKLQGRWAFGLPTGTGKTSAVIAWVASLAALGVDHVSVAVAASKVEALCQLKRDLIKQGVPPHRIGLVHSYKHDPTKGQAEGYASEPSEGEDRQVLLVTHQRVRGCDLTGFATYRGKPRDLLLYDESLVVSDSVGIQINLLKGAVGWLASSQEHSAAHGPLIGYLSECRDLIVSQLDKLKVDGGGEGIVSLPSRSPEELQTFAMTLGRHPAVDVAHELLEIANQPIRVIPTQQGGVVSYQVSVPAEISNIIVLDASHPIRRLVHLDRSIRDAETELPHMQRIGCRLSEIKRFDRVTIHQLIKGGGRETMRQDFTHERREDRKVSREIVEVVKGVPPDQGILVFTYKLRASERVDYAKTLLGDLEEAGVDTSATVMTSDGPRPRISVVTWGNETSLNCYSYATHVILAGVLQRSPVDLAGAFLGQSNDLHAAIPSEVVRSLGLSESCHMIYQALSRGSCRVVDNGQAKKMDAWIIHRDDAIQHELAKVMPGAQWVPWVATEGGCSPEIIKTTAAKIASHLDSITTSSSISSRVLKRILGLQEVPQRTFTYALHHALKLRSEWVLEGRSVVRGSKIFESTAP